MIYPASEKDTSHWSPNRPEAINSELNHLARSYRSRACLVALNSQLWQYAKRKFLVTSNLWYMHRVLNVDEIKN